MPGTPGNLVIESKLSTCSASEALRELKTIQSGAIKFFLKKRSLRKLYKLRVLRTGQRYLTLKKQKCPSPCLINRQFNYVSVV